MRNTVACSPYAAFEQRPHLKLLGNRAQVGRLPLDLESFGRQALGELGGQNLDDHIAAQSLVAREKDA